MPIYEYACQTCQQRFEKLLRSPSGTEKVQCPKCGSTATTRAISVFAVASAAATRDEDAPADFCQRCGGEGPCALE